jgi:hypothetical protein
MRIPSYVTELNFNTLQEYFDYILESKVNGQHRQARGLFRKMDYFERHSFFEYIEELYFSDTQGAEPNLSDEPSDLELLKIYFKSKA